MLSNTTPTAVWVVIPAAGIGTRMQADRPKQYLKLGQKTVLEHTIGCFERHPAITGVVVVLNPYDPYWNELDLKPFKKAIHCTDGGKERGDSVLNGLRYLQDDLKLPDNTVVLVHDAARPCLNMTDLSQLIAATEHCPDGAILAYPVRDTMKRANPDTQQIVRTEPRENLWHALTPQAASLGVLSRVLAEGLAAGASITDEASALEWAGLNPHLIEGSALNIKITRPSDLTLARLLLALDENTA